MYNPNLQDLIISESRRLGFQDIGFAKVETLDEEIEHYKDWLAKNYHADMKWMERNIDKKHNPGLVLENAKSVIAVSFNYYTEYKHSKIEVIQGKAGKISRYAWGDDYHDIVLPKLKLLCAYLDEISPGNIHKCYVDTGPVMDKIWAERCGIGWQGKNSLVISKKHGSFFFIGIIFTTLELAPSSQIKDYCLSCTKCISACPTGAIVAPKIIDSQKCLSYWTIEAKPVHNIPKEIADKSESWLFGCDICQDVCPWNKNLPQATDDKRFEPRLGHTELDFDYIDELEQADFSARFKNSPIKRLKLAGLKRNKKDLK